MSSGKAGKLFAATARLQPALPAARHRDPQSRWAERAVHTAQSADHDRLHGPAGLLRHHLGEGGGGGDCEGEAGGGGDAGGPWARGAGARGSGRAEGTGSFAGHAALGGKSKFSGES